jgi:transcriptional regulator with XRE-family HTH domain
MKVGRKHRVRIDRFEYWLRYYRKLANMTQFDLGYEIDRGTSVISNWEKGWSQPPLADLEKLAIIFNISIDSFFQAIPKSRTRKVKKQK